MNNSAVPHPDLLTETLQSNDEQNNTRISLDDAAAAASDDRPSEEDSLSEYDKAVADSFPASDPPTQP